jgi:glutamate decarboxylase
VLRVVCRNGFSHDLADLFLSDLKAAVEALRGLDCVATLSGPTGFHH